MILASCCITAAIRGAAILRNSEGHPSSKKVLPCICEESSISEEAGLGLLIFWPLVQGSQQAKQNIQNIKRRLAAFDTCRVHDSRLPSSRGCGRRLQKLRSGADGLSGSCGSSVLRCPGLCKAARLAGSKRQEELIMEVRAGGRGAEAGMCNKCMGA